jgi:heparanase 1
VDERYLSVAIDSSQLVGGHWWSPEGGVEAIGRRRVPPVDLGRERLRDLAQALAPAYLRIGGTEADRIYYAVGDNGAEPPPPGYDLVLSSARWAELVDFAKSVGLDLFFTLNAGPSTRDEKGRWTTENAERLLRHASSRGDQIAALELGNEINGYWFTYGLSQQPDGTTVADDIEKMRAVATKWMPGALVVGPAEFYWPRVGSPFASRTHVLSGLFEGRTPRLDAVTWHYYPVQSRRCPIATRRASPTELLDPSSLDEISRWADDVESKSGRGVPVWMSETGGAQCGGEPGVSDRFASSLWWMDELGVLARRGQPVVVRQTLLGSNYGLLDDATLSARPDYFASVLYKRLMGRVVLDAHRHAGGDPFLRVYASCTAERAGKRTGSITLLAINLHQHDQATVQLGGATGRSLERYQVTAPSLDSNEVLLNGQCLAPTSDASAMEPRQGRFDGALTVAPLSYELDVIDADWPACR